MTISPIYCITPQNHLVQWKFTMTAADFACKSSIQAKKRKGKREGERKTKLKGDSSRPKFINSKYINSILYNHTAGNEILAH